jgi:hypothetical protein
MSPTKSGSKRSAKAKKAPAKRKTTTKQAPMEKKEERVPWSTGTEREGMEHEDNEQQWHEPEKEPVGQPQGDSR